MVRIFYHYDDIDIQILSSVHSQVITSRQDKGVTHLKYVNIHLNKKKPFVYSHTQVLCLI